METILKNQYVVMYIDKNREFINDVWNEASGKMTTDEFKGILLQWKDLVIEHQLKKALIDTRKMAFMIEPSLQNWIAENINKPVKEKGFKRIATLLPSTIFEKVAMEQTMKEFTSVNNFQTHIFDDEDVAKEWLFD